MIVEKQYRIESLVLSGRCNISIYNQMGQKSFDFRLSHILRMPLIVKQDKPLYPRYIRSFGANGISFQPNELPDFVQ
jgi:hypothetical protein